MSIVYSGDKITFADGSTVASGWAGFKNRLINSDMRIDQRNAGASVTSNNTGAVIYTLDRWGTYGSVVSKFSVQQNAGSVTPPTGFTNYLGATSLSAYSLVSSDAFVVLQYIEGNNVADLGWGTAAAQTVTVSFWVRSSLTGTFGGAIRNANTTRGYPFSYTINSANTWEYKTITIPGDTTGTWATNNTTGIAILFSLGTGSSQSGTAGSWQTGLFSSATGATSVVGTNGATFYLTGVQLEKGSTATSFDYRPYGTELQLCQRYYEVAQVPSSTSLWVGALGYASAYYVYWPFKVTKRASPTLSIGSGASWVGATATAFAGSTEVAQYYHVNTAYYLSGSSGVVGTIASAEL